MTSLGAYVATCHIKYCKLGHDCRRVRSHRRRRNSTVESRRRRRCVLGLKNAIINALGVGSQAYVERLYCSLWQSGSTKLRKRNKRKVWTLEKEFS